MRILVSACLLGVGCRFDGRSKPCKEVASLLKEHTLIPVCPEIYGGLPTPRPPAEIRDGKVITKEGTDVTAQYHKGAEQTLVLARLYGCKAAILKENSPSCGVGNIYDGTFSGSLAEGDGVSAALLKAHGLKVYTEKQVRLFKQEAGGQTDNNTVLEE